MSDEATPYDPGLNRLRRRYEGLSEAGNLATAFGNTATAERYGGRAASTLARLTARGGDVEGLNIAGFEGEFDPSTASRAINILARARGLGKEDPRAAQNRAQNRMWSRVSDVGEERRRTAFNENILPTYTGAMERLNELAGTAAISAEQESLLRSKIATTNRTAAASNLGRVASALGLRGMADSPAAAALASSVARDYDIGLQNRLSDVGLQVSQINREQAARDQFAAAEMARLRGDAETAYLAKDATAIQSIGRDTAALIDSLYSRDRATELMERQLEEAGGGSSGSGAAIGSGIGALAALAAAPFTAGASLALLPALTAGGGAVGGAVEGW